MKNNIIERFTKLVKYDTKSNQDSKTYPSTKSQLEFGKLLKKICEEIKLGDVTIDEYGYVTACLPSNISKDVPTIGFLAHMDTSPDYNGTNINPQLIENYDGNDIVLKNNETLSIKEFPDLKNYKGQTLITSDGNTLLGADDKAGITIILEAMDYLIKNPQIPHGKIMIAFTPDEEIGRGVDFFDIIEFGADFAYTIDGSGIGELNYETFNAAHANIVIEGKSVHPGTAKDVMINSILIANEIINSLPKKEIPQETSGYEGFYHITNFTGSIPETKLDIIIRDFDKNNFENRKNNISKIIENLNKLYDNRIKLNISDQYYNMAKIIEENIYIFDLAKKAFEECSVKPIIQPIRGGTDGSRLSYMGLPCPNIFTGGHNFHGPLEYVCVESMVKSAEIVVKICELNTK